MFELVDRKLRWQRIKGQAVSDSQEVINLWSGKERLTDTYKALGLILSFTRKETCVLQKPASLVSLLK